MRSAICIGLALVLLVACGGATQRSTEPNTGATSGASALKPSRTLVAAIDREPPTLALRPLRETFASGYFSNRAFNADLALIDDQGAVHPYLAEALPQLNTDS